MIGQPYELAYKTRENGHAPKLCGHIENSLKRHDYQLLQTEIYIQVKSKHY